MKHFSFIWHNTVTLLIFVKSQFTTNVQNVLTLNQFAHGHVLSRIIALFPRRRGGSELSDKRKKCVCVQSLHFQQELQTTGVFVSVPMDKYVKVWCCAKVWLVPWKLLAGVYYCDRLFLVWCEELTPEVCPGILRVHTLCKVKPSQWAGGGGGEIFSTRPDPPRGPPSLLYNG